MPVKQSPRNSPGLQESSPSHCILGSSTFKSGSTVQTSLETVTASGTQTRESDILSARSADRGSFKSNIWDKEASLNEKNKPVTNSAQDLSSQSDKSISTSLKGLVSTKSEGSAATSQIQYTDLHYTFKILVILTSLLFVSPLLTVFANFSCTGTSGLCVPHVKVQMYNFATNTNLSSALDSLAKGVAVTLYRDDHPFRWQFNGPLSGELGTFKADVRDSLKILFNASTTYSVGEFGYCKDTPTTSECHDLVAPFDIPRVLLNELAVELANSSRTRMEYPNVTVLTSTLVHRYRKLLRSQHDDSGSWNELQKVASIAPTQIWLMLSAAAINIISISVSSSLCLYLQKKRFAVSSSLAGVVRWLTTGITCLCILCIFLLVGSLILESKVAEFLLRAQADVQIKLIHVFNWETSGSRLNAIVVAFYSLVAFGCLVLLQGYSSRDDIDDKNGK